MTTNAVGMPIRHEPENLALLTLQLASDDIAAAIRATVATDYDRAAHHITDATDLLAVALNRL
ncbi:hypothetical protein [Microbacterium panaciterrae]|uniref:Uncharacterized protein n=1 Tax=Microbacterium panaciterrae TaxID=985759 RepID=A0ABP8PCI6_9MICO